ncbi:MAG: endonuclease/exonuclease/phosphatase family protein [Sphingobacterium composti]
MMKGIILNWILLIFCANTLFAQKEKLPLKLRVCSYNIGHFNQGSLGGFQLNKNVAQAELNRWKQWIGQEGFDILSLNEWNTFFDKDSTYHAQEHLLDPFYSTVVWGENKRWIYNGLATNYNLTNIRQKNWDGDYYAILADWHVGGEVITIISTHIPWQKNMHDNSLSLLIDELKQYKYFICLGDMNASDQNQLKFTKEGFNMANGGHLGWFNTCGGKALKSGYQGATDYNIDNIITSSNIKIFNVSAPTTGLNDLDHLPIIADVVITWN